MKKKNKRSQAKYPALDKTYNLKTRTDLYDFDYINGYYDEETGMSIRPLNNKEKEYLNNFVSEYINADFDPNRKRVQKKKKVEHPQNHELKKLQKALLEYLKEMNEQIKATNVTVSSKNNIKKLIFQFKNKLKKKIAKEFKYVLDYYKKEAYDSNNSRNRCILTKAKASGKYVSMTELPEQKYFDINSEDEIIERLDLTEQSKNAKDDADNS